MRATAPSRGDKLTLSFGLINIPVTVFNAMDENAGKIKREMRTSAGNPVGFATSDKVTGELVSRESTKMVFGTEKGEVELSDEEIASAMGQENGSCELIGVYPSDDISDLFTAGYRQVRPQTVLVGKKKTNPYDKVFSLFMQVLRTDDMIALIRYTLRGKPQIGALDGYGWLHVLHWEDEIREELPLEEVEVSEKEFDYASDLIQSYVQSSKFPELTNDGVAKVREYAENKAAGAKPKDVEVPKQTTADDLMAQLMASVEGAKAK